MSWQGQGQGRQSGRVKAKMTVYSRVKGVRDRDRAKQEQSQGQVQKRTEHDSHPGLLSRDKLPELPAKALNGIFIGLGYN